MSRLSPFLSLLITLGTASSWFTRIIKDAAQQSFQESIVAAAASQGKSGCKQKRSHIGPLFHISSSK